MKLTAAQYRFLKGINDSHVTYTTIGRQLAMVRRLERLGYVKIVQDYFAYITDAGVEAVSRTGSQQ